MNRNWLRVAFRFLWLVVAVGCTSRGALGDAERASLEAAVDSATRAFADAERARDAERVVAHLADDFYMYNDGVRRTYDDVVGDIRQTMGTLRHFEPAWRDVAVRALGSNAALVSFTFRDSIVTGAGETIRLWGPTTLIWERRGADWLIVYADADHYPVP